jgi:hypothetical protein
MPQNCLPAGIVVLAIFGDLRVLLPTAMLQLDTSAFALGAESNLDLRIQSQLGAHQVKATNRADNVTIGFMMVTIVVASLRRANGDGHSDVRKRTTLVSVILMV